MPGAPQRGGVSDVVSFRPTKEEEEMIERTRRRIGAKSRTEAVRWLVRKGDEATPKLADSPVFKFRLPKRYRSREELTGKDIDHLVYGDLWRDRRRGRR